MRVSLAAFVLVATLASAVALPRLLVGKTGDTPVALGDSPAAASRTAVQGLQKAPLRPPAPARIVLAARPATPAKPAAAPKAHRPAHAAAHRVARASQPVVAPRP